jgi:penicillin-binding protein 1A
VPQQQNPQGDNVVSSNQKRSTHKKNKKQQQKKAKKKKSLPRRIIKGVLVTGLTVTSLTLVGTGIVGAYAWNQYGDVIQNSVTKGYEIAGTVKETDFMTKSPTKIVDKDGKELKVFKEFQYETPTFKQINPNFTVALISAEDERFYDHHGVDLYGTLRGIASTLQGNGVQGGSTITQQLVRNVILESSEVTVERKLIEQVVSQEVEKQMSKDEIVRHYLNNVYFGNGNYGIAPASRYYFSKDQKDILLHEAATIIGITNNPSVFDPIQNPESSLKKRNRVLGKMLEVGAITKAEHVEAVNQPLGIKVTKHGIDNSVTEPALSYALQKSTEHLMEKDGFVFQTVFVNDEARTTYKAKYHEEFMKVRQSILNGGYFIETSIDQEKQKDLENVVAKVMSPLRAKDPKTGFYQTQTAITTLDNETGEVVAIVGGRGEDGNIFNRGYQGVRQPGSTIKPLVAYTPAFEMGYTPESRMTDSYIKNGPANVYNGYKGSVTLRYATEISINTVAYKLANKIGGENMVGKLSKMKFSSLAPEDENPIIALGGFTYGTTTVEIASGYASLINQGVYREPSNVRQIKDIVTNEVLYKRDENERKVYDSGASYLMVDTLKGVMKKGSGTLGMPNNYPYVMGKTGTTNNSKDRWFVGGTPYYTTAIWTGRDTPSSLSTYERTMADLMFKEWNEELHKGKKFKDFKRPDTVWKQNGIWMTSVKQVERERKNRRYSDSLRRDAEQTAQKERLALEDYRIIHGLTLEEETARENAVKDALEEFYGTPFDELEQYEEQFNMLEDIKPLIDKVKHKRAMDAFIMDWETSMERINAKRDDFLAEIERQRLEEERLKFEAEEAIRLEEERLIQEEVERRLAEEIEALEAEEAERARVEAEEKALLELEEQELEDLEVVEEEDIETEPPSTEGSTPDTSKTP